MRHHVVPIAIVLTLAWTASAQVKKPSPVVEKLPPVEGVRLTAFQAQLTGRTQRALHRLNPARIGEVEQLLTDHNLCFREIARLEVHAAYLRVAAALSGQEQGEVLSHLRSPAAVAMLRFEEGSVARLTIAADDPALATLSPSVDRFHRLVRQHVRSIALTPSGPACQTAMEADFKHRRLAFTPGQIR